MTQTAGAFVRVRFNKDLKNEANEILSSMRKDRKKAIIGWEAAHLQK